MEQQEGRARKQKKTMNNGAESYGMLSARRRVCQNTLFITEDRYIAELSYEVAI